MKQTLISVGASAVVSLLLVLGLAGGDPSVIERVIEKSPLGAITGPDIPSPYLRWGDVQVHLRKGNIRTATTTATDWVNTPECVVQAPAATSTLGANTGLIFNAGPTSTPGPGKLLVTTGLKDYATTTLLFAKDITKSMDGIRATSTVGVTADTATVSQTIIAPNAFVQFSMTNLPNPHGANLGVTGTCQAEFITAQ